MIDEEALNKRISQFEKNNMNLILTTQGIFYKKAELMPKCCFVLGFDTFIRIIDLKYYGNDIKVFKDCFINFIKYETSFLVAGRLNRKTNAFEKLENEMLSNIPEEFRYLFEPLDSFREDISST